MSAEKLTPTPVKAVRLDAGFWGDRHRLLREVILPYQWEALNDRVPNAPPSYAVRNLRIAAGEATGDYQGPVFQDSDLAKWLEAVGHCLAVQRDPKLEQRADSVIELIRKAQWDDGYLNSYFTVTNPEGRWTNLRDAHELYCGGHLIEAAVAYYEATGKRVLLEAMCRFADHVGQVFGRGRGQKHGYPGHEEIELALVKLYRTTGRRRYLDLAAYFIDERGRQPHYFDLESLARGEEPQPTIYGSYVPYDEYQAHLPVRQQKTAEGHAVRAMYLFCGMADVAAETGDRTLVEACQKLWENTVQRRMYITGGIGSQCHGERFTFDYDLPNDTAYTETCAVIGLVFWAHRMLHLELDGKYADVMERALYNGVLSGVSMDGKHTFYVNPLAVWPSACEKRADTRHVRITRQPWFECACCPPNLARLLASIGGYVYSTGAQSIAVHLYTSSSACLTVRGQTVSLKQETRYPWEETILLTVKPREPSRFRLCLRIPSWCRDPRLSVNSKSVDLQSTVENGYARIDRRWAPGDRVELMLPMPVERIRAHPEVRENAGRVALQRGPLVYCLEETDNGPNLPALAIPSAAELSAHFEKDLLGGITVITGTARRANVNDWGEALYRPVEPETESVSLKAVPYFVWANRDPGEMLVWVREG